MSLIIAGKNLTLLESYPNLETQPCFYCGRPIGESHGVWWQVRHADVYLHADCTLEFASRLMAELGVLQATLAPFPRVLTDEETRLLEGGRAKQGYGGVSAFFDRVKRTAV